MRVGFVFDTILLKKDSNYYGLTLTYDFFRNRYLDKCEEINIITREKLDEKYSGSTTGYRITNGKNVDVNPIKEYVSIPDAIIKKKKIKKSLEKEILKCDKVIIRMPSVLGILACNICEKLKKPYMIEMVACAWDGYKNHTNKLGIVIAPFMYLLTKRCVRKCDYTLYVTSEFLQRRYPTNGSAFACSDVELLEDKENTLNSRLERNSKFNKSNFSICTTANVGMRYKGHIYALKAIKKLKNDGINVKYYLIGNGNQAFLKEYIVKNKLEDNVVFMGSLSHNEVFEQLDKIDIYIQPSLQEGLPRALVEAMSRGCCCIGSNVGGIPELLDSKYIFKRKNATELYHMLKNISINDINEQSKKNYIKSKEFEKNILDKKRNKIYSKFLEG